NPLWTVQYAGFLCCILFHLDYYFPVLWSEFILFWYILFISPALNRIHVPYLYSLYLIPFAIFYEPCTAILPQVLQNPDHSRHADTTWSRPVLPDVHQTACRFHKKIHTNYPLATKQKNAAPPASELFCYEDTHGMKWPNLADLLPRV